MAYLQERFTALLAEHRGILTRLAAVYCRGTADRQDLAQEITAELWRAFPRYDAARPFATWMYRVGLNVAITAARKSRPSVVSLDQPLDGGEPLHERIGAEAAPLEVEEDERGRALHAVIERQPPLDRALLLLWLDERCQRDIAEILGISESNVGTKLSRLKQRLRQQLQELDTD